MEYPPASSKYDYVKIKVKLEDHYYILSRFLISRVLMSTKIPYVDAVKIALELKKVLTDRGMLEIQQTTMENQLFELMEKFGYGPLYKRRWKMMARFHYERVPLIILIAGTGFVGKSFIATQLAERINLPNVIQTDFVLEFMQSMITGNKPSPENLPIWYRTYPTKEQFLEEYKKECQWVKKGVETDIDKALTEGKSVMIEGTHVDPQLYLNIIEKHSIIPPSAASASAEAPKEEKKGIIIPLILNLKEEDHRQFLENGLSRNVHAKQLSQQLGESTAEQTRVILENAKTIRTHLKAFSPPFAIINVNANKYFLETLDEIHDRILAAIQNAYKNEYFLKPLKSSGGLTSSAGSTGPAAATTVSPVKN